MLDDATGTALDGHTKTKQNHCPNPKNTPPIMLPMVTGIMFEPIMAPTETGAPYINPQLSIDMFAMLCSNPTTTNDPIKKKHDNNFDVISSDAMLIRVAKHFKYMSGQCWAKHIVTP